MQISVIGYGYVGLVTGGCLAEAGHQVLCTDNDPARIATLEAGGLPVYEPHLDAVLAATRHRGHLRFTGDSGEAVRAGQAIFICVGTPSKQDGEADLSAIDNVARVIATEARMPKLVIEKSTVPAQTGQQLKRALQVYGRNKGGSFRVASNPEFLREGRGVEDFLHPHRIIVGVEEESSERQLRDIYHPILERQFQCPVHQPDCPPSERPELLVTTMNSAELIKHASNSFLALKISYANVLADLCDRLGANVEEVTRAMGLDPRIGPQFLRAGLGFGGSCLPKDVQAFIRLAESAGVDFGILKEAERVNKRRIDQFLEKIRRSLWVIRDKQVAVLGLAFKPNTDDIRFAPAIELIGRLLAQGARVRACDPQAIDKTKAIYPQLFYSPDPYETARDADALLITTEWQEFRDLDWQRMRALMTRPLVLDARNLLDPAAMQTLGFEYHSLGRPDT
ncbi:MAG: UDP-glucose/GDP-mannose dehydrogenase family protein [Acidobacteria bacterium]|nr:UDP-glucose/GDP-mannose dehydrogenase family protein [Acidobacteriota bacterium]